MTRHPIFGNEMIRASAGTGKTYQLVSRYVALLACDVKPQRILTLTFTRKAAGEFFSRILTRLAEYAKNQKEADKFLRELGLPEGKDFSGLLRLFLKNIPNIRLSTLDSFFVSIVRLFPHELGLPAQFEILQDAPLARLRRETLCAVLHSTPSQPLSQSIKQSFLGKDRANIAETLEDWLENRLPVFQRMPDTNLWGDFSTIFPTRKPWKPREEDSFVQNVNALVSWLKKHEITGAAQLDTIDKISHFLLKRPPGTPLVFETVSRNFFAVAADPTKTWMIARKGFKLDLEHTKLLNHIVDRWFARECLARCAITNAQAAILQNFHQDWTRRTQRVGSLTFNDLPIILSAGSTGIGSQISNRAGHLLRIDERLDERLDHWLLDEFQDTSPTQWRVIENLIDETIQDPSHERSFFGVGDTKQALYGFRGGDDRLFPHLLARYPKAENGYGLSERTMAETRRCGPAIVEFVNHVFNPESSYFSKHLSSVRKRWNFQTHSCEASLARSPSHAALIEYPLDQTEEKSEIPSELINATKEVIHTLKINDSCRTCAILVRTRKEITLWVTALRGIGCSASGNAETSLTDNHPFAIALLALLTHATHPRNTMAKEHFLMSPLANSIPRDGKKPTDFYHETRDIIARQGFGSWTRLWIDRASESSVSFDHDQRARALNFLRFCEYYDDTFGSNPDRFLHDAFAHPQREIAQPGTIEVMTFHASKGLEYDIVIIPSPEKLTFNSREKLPPLGVAEDANMRPLWVIDMPNSVLAEAIPEINPIHQQNIDANTYQNLCALYVAMTRARHGLYLLLPEIKEQKSATPSTNTNAASLLRASLPENHRKWNNLTPVSQSGVPLSQISLKQSHLQHKSPPNLTRAIAILPRGFTRRRPSGEKETVVPASLKVSSKRNLALQRGNLLHALMEHLTWPDQQTSKNRLAAWKYAKLDSHEHFQDTADEIERFLRNPDIATALSRPNSGANLLREHNFEMILDGTWISGSFDRVQWPLSSDGTIILIDYKTNLLDINSSDAREAIAHLYRPQMNLYRQALTALSPTPRPIKTGLILTHIAEIVWV